MAESGCLRDVAVQNLEVVNPIIVNGVTSTEIDGDLSAFTTVTKQTLLNDDIVRYVIDLDLSSGFETPSSTDGDIIGLTDAASTVVNLPADFTLISGCARNTVAEGGTLAVNIVLSSQDNLAEDALVTDELVMLNNLNGNSATTTYTSFESVDHTGTRRFVYLTNNGTGNNTALGAAKFEIVLVGRINKGSLPIVPSFGGRRMAIGYSASEFATAGDSEKGHFMLTPGTASAQAGSLVIPKGAFITAVFVKSSVTIAGGSATYVIGLDDASGEAAGRKIFFTNVTLANANTGALVQFGKQSAPQNNAATDVPEGAGLAFAQAAAAADAVGQHYTTARQFVTYGVNSASNTAGELKIMIEYILV